MIVKSAKKYLKKTKGKKSVYSEEYAVQKIKLKMVLEATVFIFVHLENNTLNSEKVKEVL